MSRIGRAPIAVPDGVTVDISGSNVTVKGPKGELSHRLASPITVAQEDGQLVVSRPTDRAPHRALHGLTRSLVANMVEGVTNGFQKKLQLVGVGYRAQMKGKDLEISAGFSHPVLISPPEGVEFQTPEPTEIVVSGIRKDAVGQIAADIRKVRPPEPYKGKGIKYEGEHIRRKVGKRA